MERTINEKQLEQVILLAEQKKRADEERQPTLDKIEAIKDLEENCTETVLYDKIGPAVDIEKRYLQAALNEVAPSADRVVAYCKENGFVLSPEAKRKLLVRATQELFPDHIIDCSNYYRVDYCISIEKTTNVPRRWPFKSKITTTPVAWMYYDPQPDTLSINCTMEYAASVKAALEEIENVAHMITIKEVNKVIHIK